MTTVRLFMLIPFRCGFGGYCRTARQMSLMPLALDPPLEEATLYASTGRTRAAHVRTEQQRLRRSSADSRTELRS